MVLFRNNINRIVYTLLVVLILSISSILKYSNLTYENVSNYQLDSVEKRVLESHENWLRSLDKRNKLEKQYPLDEKDQWSYKGGINFWDFFYPSFDCPYTAERLGRSGDGGKWICGFNYIAKRSKSRPCVVYSFGVSTEWSFEQEISDRSNCSVYMYDHTIDVSTVTLPREYPKRVFIESMGLGANDDKATRSLKTIMKKNGHTFVDIVKMDIEAAEFQVLQSWDAAFPDGPPIGQLAVEIHLPTDPSPKLYANSKPWMTAMENMGLRPYRYEINPGAVYSSKRHTPHCWEYAFINVKYDHYLLHEEME